MRVSFASICFGVGMAAWLCMAVVPQPALAQPPPSKLAPILKDMTQQGPQFSAQELHEMGLEGLRMLLDWFFPETAKPVTREPPSQMVLELVSQLADDSFRLREEAAEKLYQLGSAAHTALLKAAESNDAEVRWRATRILRRWQMEREQDMARYGPALAVYLSGIKDKQRLEELAVRVRSVLEHSNGPPSGGRATLVSPFFAVLADPENAPLAARLKPLLDHPNPQVPVYVLNMLANYAGRYKDCPPLLLDALDASRTELILAAIGAAGHVPLGGTEEEVKRRLTRIFHGEDETLKFQVSRVLWSRFDDRQALEHLLAQVKKSSNEDMSRRYEAIGMLRDSRSRNKLLDAETVKKFVELMDPKDQNLRLMVAETLAWYGGEEVVRALIAMMGDTYQPVAQLAQRKLLEQPDKEMVRRLLASALEEAKKTEAKLAAEGNPNPVAIARQQALQKHIEGLLKLLGKPQGDSVKSAQPSAASRLRVVHPEGTGRDPVE